MRTLPFLLTLALPAIAGAQGIVIPRCPAPRPNRPIMDCMPARAQVVRTRSDVKVELRDRVLRYEVEERFVNRGGTIGEADYIFPLPKNAAFRDLKLSIDGEMVAGETMNAVEARQIYEDIVRRQKDPALVEWMGHGMLRTRIFPFQAGEERRIVIRYESVAEREGDAMRVDYFRGRANENVVEPQVLVRPAQQSRGTVMDRGRTTFTLTYRAGGELGEPYSPTHELDIDREAAIRRVSIDGGGPDITVLVAMRRSSAASVSVLSNARRDEPGYALITVTPPADVASSRLPRDVTFVIDVSGSMSGQKLEQAKAAGRQLLRTLNPRDRFRVVDFSTDVRSFRDEFVFATEANVRAAVRYLDDLEAVGSTNISGALEEALRTMARRPATGEPRTDEEGLLVSDRMPLVLFMTDGAPTVGLRDPADIAARAARLRGDARVFSVGMGADVNVGLIEQLALEGRGTAHFVRPDENVERAVELLATRLRQPLLTDVRVTTDGNVRLSRVYPSGALDVFAGQDLVILARYEGNGPTNVVVSGRSGGRQVRWSSQRMFPREERDNAFVPRLWATQRIGWLAAEKRRNGGSSEVDQEIRQLGERFGIPTEFTSYLVLEPGVVAQRGPQDATRLRRAGVGSVAGNVAPTAAAAPEARFEAARTSASQREAKSVAAADMASGVTSSDMRRAGARLFQRSGEVWTDAAMKPELQVYKVKAYSRSYFALVERIPELKEAFAVGDRVVVAGRSIAIEVVSDAAELSADDLEQIVRKF
ncbi:MAG TPA: VIT domain-containing protein [Gemmatimonadaceae bacterium]|nr:VIT domain-containing protein [Gemmatimonadaceae bacterium]